MRFNLLNRQCSAVAAMSLIGAMFINGCGTAFASGWGLNWQELREQAKERKRSEELKKELEKWDQIEAQKIIEQAVSCTTSREKIYQFPDTIKNTRGKLRNEIIRELSSKELKKNRELLLDSFGSEVFEPLFSHVDEETFGCFFNSLSSNEEKEKFMNNFRPYFYEELKSNIGLPNYINFVFSLIDYLEISERLREYSERNFKIYKRYKDRSRKLHKKI